MTPEDQHSPPPRRYTWPWFVLAAFLLGVVLAIFWMSAEVKRTRERRQADPFRSPPQTAVPSTNR